MLMKFALTAVLSLLTSSFALADKMGPNGDKFYEAAAKFENACLEGACQTPYSMVVAFDRSAHIDQLDSVSKTSLRKIAVEQAQVWGDSILEGDYHAGGYTRLDRVVNYYRGKNLVGSKIIYSEKAWYVGDCRFDGTRDSLRECRTGRIAEGSYVSPDHQTFFSDEERHAQFSFTEK